MSVSKWLLDPATPHRAVFDHVQRRWRQVENGGYEICIALRRLFEDNLHRHEGYARFEDFAEGKFGIRERLVGSFLFLARHLKKLPKTRAALESGDLTYTKAREFVRIATPDDEARWIEFARKRPPRRTRENHRETVTSRLVSGARHGVRSRSGPDPETGRIVIEGEAPLEKYYRADGEFIGYGFDPTSHVGGSLRTSREDDPDPPESSSAAD